MIRDLIDSIGEAVDLRWRAEQYACDSLPEIAVDELRQAGLAGKLAADDVMAYLFSETELHESLDRFSDYQQTVFRTSHFYIELLIWLDSTTSRHQHAFSGAFEVLVGSSCHSTFAFETGATINERLETGSVSWLNSEILCEGDIRGIVAGSDYIHSLFHLAYPSITLVVRSYELPSSLPQWRYYWPTVRIDPLLGGGKHSYEAAKRRSLVGVAWSSDLSLGDKLARDLVIKEDAETIFRFIIGESRPSQNGQNASWRARIHSELEDRWPEIWLPCKVAIERHKRDLEAVLRRKSLENKQHRLILALLLNVPDRTTLLNFIESELDVQSPASVLAECLEAMGYEGCGIRINGSSRRILELVLSGAELKSILATLRSEAGAKQVARYRDEISQYYKYLSTVPLLSVFFE